jgi:prevent-host-death family protein
MDSIVSLYDAKTHLSALVDKAAAGEEIIITKNGVPQARLAPIPQNGKRRVPVGDFKVTYIAEDFDAADEEINAMFYGEP